MTNLDYSEEAFLFNSLQEVAKVWKRGRGRASFNLNVSDGVAEVALTFTLGHPSDLHHSPPHVKPQHDHLNHQHGHQVHRPQRRHKGPAQRERDRLRAAAHRSSRERLTAAPAVILPFAGKILQMKAPSQKSDTEAELSAAAAPAAPSAAAASAVTSAGGATASNPVAAASAVTPPVALQPAAVRPTKSFQTPLSMTKNIDANPAKKQLFPLPPRQVPPSTLQLQPGAKCYQMREDDLWTKLFS